MVSTKNSERIGSRSLPTARTESPMTIFQRLHQGPTLLILPNAWDAGSARLIESLGATAIATTSAGLAWSRGYPDGNALPNDQLIAATRDIARTIGVPLSIDIEEGYSDKVSAVAQLAAGVMNAGAAGFLAGDVGEMFGAAAAYGKMNALFTRNIHA
jgi:2-methylisocitrate lyase-like PEP mutase family enzyme